MKKSKIYCIDIDGTICNNTYGAYAKAEPMLDRIEKINHLYNEGNTIVYYTARGMSSFGGDQAKVYEKFYDFTKRQLELWGCKYHELKLGKLSYDYWIDDKAERDSEFFDDSYCGIRRTK